MHRTDLQLTTNPGLEALALDEVRARADAAGVSVVDSELRPNGLAGHLMVVLDAPWEAVRPLALGLCSVHRLVRTVGRFPIDPAAPLAGIRKTVAALTPSIPELDPPEVTFGVRCKRIGTHELTSEDVGRDAGAGVRDVRPRRVRLKHPDVALRCDVRDEHCILGVTIAVLSQRGSGPYTQRTSLRANVAWALLQLARPDPAAPPTRLLDPFAGAGTVLLEAASRWPNLILAGGDRLEAPTSGTRQNLAHAGYADRSDIRQADARHLPEVWPEGGFDTVVCNPPFGKRLGQNLDRVGFYRDVLKSAAAVAAPDARMALLVFKRKAFNRALRISDWRLARVQVVEIGGLYVGMYALSLSADQRLD